MPQGPNAISLNQCCCGEEAGCLDGVCFVTVEFRNVKNPVVVPDEGEQPNCPPDLGLGCNNPAQGAIDQPSDPQPVCTDCDDWNREWELVLLPDRDTPDQKLGDGSTDFVFALGQERDTESGGYSEEPRVYDVPGGSTCFPCADVNDDTGIRLSITCVGEDRFGNEQITLDLEFIVEGCLLVTWKWNEFVPVIFNSERTQGIPRPASSITSDFQDGWIESRPAGAFCYTPIGLCKVDPEGSVFPCFSGDQTDPIATFYDRQNCYWSNEDIDKPQVRFYLCESTTNVDNPSECDVCVDETILFDSKDFDVIAGIAVEDSPYDQPETAVEDHILRPITDSGGTPSKLALRDKTPCPDPFPPPDNAICTYDVFLRWGRNTSTSAAATVWIYTTDPGSGPVVDLTIDDLPLANGTLDGKHNTDFLKIDGVEFQFRKIGQFPVACDALLTFEFEGPRDFNERVDFDAFAIRRL